MMKCKDECCDKKGMHGYRVFLCMILFVVVGCGILYLFCCGKQDEIPEEGTLVKDMNHLKEDCKTLKEDGIKAAEGKVQETAEQVKHAAKETVQDVTEKARETAENVKAAGEQWKEDMKEEICEDCYEDGEC